MVLVVIPDILGNHTKIGFKMEFRGELVRGVNSLPKFWIEFTPLPRSLPNSMIEFSRVGASFRNSQVALGSPVSNS